MNPSMTVTRSFVTVLLALSVINANSLQPTFKSCDTLSELSLSAIQTVNSLRDAVDIHTLIPSLEMTKTAFGHIDNLNCKEGEYGMTNKCDGYDLRSWGNGPTCGKESEPSDGCCNNIEDCTVRMKDNYGPYDASVHNVILQWDYPIYVSTPVELLKDLLEYVAQAYEAGGDLYKLMNNPASNELGVWVTAKTIAIYTGDSKKRDRPECTVPEPRTKLQGLPMSHEMLEFSCDSYAPTWYVHALVSWINKMRMYKGLGQLKWVEALTEFAFDHVHNIESPVCKESVEIYLNDLRTRCSRELDAWKDLSACYPPNTYDTTGCCPSMKRSCSVSKVQALNPSWEGEAFEIINKLSKTDNIQAYVYTLSMNPYLQDIMLSPKWTTIGVAVLPALESSDVYVSMWFGKAFAASMDHHCKLHSKDSYVLRGNAMKYLRKLQESSSTTPSPPEDTTTTLPLDPTTTPTPAPVDPTTTTTPTPAPITTTQPATTTSSSTTTPSTTTTPTTPSTSTPSTTSQPTTPTSSTPTTTPSTSTPASTPTSTTPSTATSTMPEAEDLTTTTQAAAGDTTVYVPPQITTPSSAPKGDIRLSLSICVITVLAYYS